MLKELKLLRDVFVKLGKLYKSDFYIWNGTRTIQGELSFAKLPSRISTIINDETVRLLKKYMRFTKGTDRVIYVNDTSPLKKAIDEIIMTNKEAIKTDPAVEITILPDVQQRLSSIYKDVLDKKMEKIKMEIIKYESTVVQYDYYTLPIEDDVYLNDVLKKLFIEKTHIELKDQNELCPNVIIAAPLFPLLTEKNISLFEYTCTKLYEDDISILYAMVHRMSLDYFVLYASYHYIDVE